MGVCGALPWTFAVGVVGSDITRTWLFRVLGYVEKLCINARGAFLATRKAYADLLLLLHACDEDHRQCHMIQTWCDQFRMRRLEGFGVLFTSGISNAVGHLSDYSKPDDRGIKIGDRSELGRCWVA